MKKTREFWIKQCPVNTEYCFLSFNYALKHNYSPNDYVCVYRGTIETETVNEALEKIFEIFNVNRPADYYARSLSVSDVVELDHVDYYCDRFGWSECPKGREK